MWNAVATLSNERVVIASGRYVEMLDAARQWLSEQGDVWFDLPKPANLLSTAEMEELGIEFVEVEEAE